MNANFISSKSFALVIVVSIQSHLCIYARAHDMHLVLFDNIEVQRIVTKYCS
jgi:hypothetical protein